MTNEEIKAMVGTEFTYVFEDGDTVRAYIKAFDPKIGLTCFTLESKSRDGYSPTLWRTDLCAEDGTFCVMAVDLEFADLSAVIDRVAEIKATGRYQANIPQCKGYFFGCAF